MYEKRNITIGDWENSIQRIFTYQDDIIQVVIPRRVTIKFDDIPLEAIEQVKNIVKVDGKKITFLKDASILVEEIDLEKKIGSGLKYIAKNNSKNKMDRPKALGDFRSKCIGVLAHNKKMVHVTNGYRPIVSHHEVDVKVFGHPSRFYILSKRGVNS